MSLRPVEMSAVLEPIAHFTLPPLILHPFADASSPNQVAESSRASLALQGFLPQGQATREELDRQLLAGRQVEIRMLFYVGKDLNRWIDQCLEFVQTHRDKVTSDLRRQSFYEFLTQNTPEPVREKLAKWGVTDYKAIFTRALALNIMFQNVPANDTMAEGFIRDYYRYADQIFSIHQSETSFDSIQAGQFDFELYSSGEYARMLEQQWAE